MEKSTTALLGSLKNTSIDDISEFVTELDTPQSYNEYFSEYLKQKNITTSEIAKKCDGFISRSYVYEIINGKKTNPSRDFLLIICLAANMDFNTTRRTLEKYDLRPLYPKDSRDAVIGIFINNGNFDINAINDRLFELNLPLIPKDEAKD